MPASKPRLRTPSAVAAAALTLGLLAGASPAGAEGARSADVRVEVERTGAKAPRTEQRAYGLTTGNRLVTFDLARPHRFDRPVSIRGLAAGTTLLGIDERPKTGQLYALAKAADGTGSLYTVDPATGAATLAAPLVTATAPKTPIVLTGSAYGFDVNPAADAIRITGDDGQNLRALPSARVTQPGSVARATGDTFVDGTLSYSPITASPRPPALGIQASAYTQNLPVTATTALFNVDSTLADLTNQTPPNDGTQVKVADVPLKGRAVQGFDITTAGTTDTGYVALSTGKRTSPKVLEKLLRLFGVRLPGSAASEIFRIDLATGALERVGVVGGWPLVDLAIDTPAPPAP